MESLTSEFGMGSGVPSPLWLPKKFRGISSNLAALHGSGRLVMGFFAHSLRSRLVRLATFEHLLRNAATQPRCHCQNIETGMEGFFEKQDARAISTGQLHPSQGFHLQPIDEVVYLGPSGLASGRTYLKAGFPLRCFQRLSLPHIATLLCRWHDNRSTSGVSIPVLSY